MFSAALRIGLRQGCAGNRVKKISAAEFAALLNGKWSAHDLGEGLVGGVAYGLHSSRFKKLRSTVRWSCLG